MDELKRLTDHFVVLGAGRVNQSMADELIAQGARGIMADTDAARIEDLPTHHYLTLAVSAQDLEHLSQFRMDAARGLAPALPDDAQSLFADLTAPDMNPNLPAAARVQT
ncbi:MAG: NAD-binding protein, partial [Clostridia bacterium]